MICFYCHGKGRVVMQSYQWQGGKQVYEFPEIGPCPQCHGGHQHCCEGDREQTLVAVGELADGTDVTQMEAAGRVKQPANPNEGC